VRAEIYRADLRNAAEADELVKSVLRDFGRIDVLINNAGLSCHGLLLQTSDEAIDAVFDVNVKGAFYMSRAVLRHMLAVRAGAIVNISSVAAAKPLVGNSCYAASKAALEGFTRALAAEVGSKGIRVNAVAPGIIDTPMTRDIRQRADGVLRSGIALRRYGTPGEVGAAVAYLASSRASFITGHVLDVSGGKDHQSLHKHP
jgi:3-oxoacyl-[acyl-carrier protein] reductase